MKGCAIKMYILRTIEEVVAYRLRQLRGDRTQADMADLLGIPLRTYNALENGQIPRPETRKLIAQKLRIGETTLFLDPDLIQEAMAQTKMSPDQAIFVLREFVENSKRQS